MIKPGYDHNSTMPSPFSLIMPFPSPLPSSLHHHVIDLPLSLLNSMVPALGKDEHGTGKNMTCPDTPRPCRTRTGTTLDAPEHAFAPLHPSSPRSLLSHVQSPPHQLAPGQPHWLAEALSPSSSSKVSRHGTAETWTSPARLRPPPATPARSLRSP
jgi:hypothetical protein